jgi:ATP-dependent metalloprotease FtsH
VQRSDRQPRPRSRKITGTVGFWALVAALLLTAGFLASLEAARPSVEGDRLGIDAFIRLAESDRIQEARFLDADGIVAGRYLRDGEAREYALPYFRNDTLRERLTLDVIVPNRIPVSVEQQAGKRIATTASFAFPVLLLIVAVLYVGLSYARGSGPFSTSSRSRRVPPDADGTTFDDVAGQDAAVAELREVADLLARSDRVAAVGATIPKGILLFGPPGCGKTLMARALAGEAGASFYSISGSDFVELYVGVGAARVRDLFEEARAHAPAIVFIDELDAVGRRRRGGTAAATGSAEEQAQALNQLLTEIDGFSPSEGVVVIGATNRPDVLDPALLRPGRFDRSVGLELPDEQARRAILDVHARGKSLDPAVDLGEVARRAVGMSGADLANVLNEAGLLAARSGRDAIGREDLVQAVDRVAEAPERQRRLAARDRDIGQRALAGERVTFGDVAGVDEAIEELAEVRDFLAEPERFRRMGARIPRGYLLVGPPGAGKTLLARAVAGESNATFVAVSASELVEVFAGEGAARVRDLFARARSAAPAIVFLDEIDAIGARRGTSVDGHGERDQTLNQILTELDGFGERTGVVVMAATNRPDILDPALVRPGRFDRSITLDLPDRGARARILELHARGKPLTADVDLDAIARLTRGMAGADLANVVNEAALLAARRGLGTIPMVLLEEGVERAGLGLARSRVLSEEERRIVAVHEAGHGLVARALPGGTVVHKLTIIPRGGSLGATWLPEADDRVLHSRSLLLERMAGLLGGRVAEQLVFGEPGDGAARDLQAVTAIARRMVTELGMSDALGALSYADGGAALSDQTARLIDDETRRFVAQAEALARRVLEGDRSALSRVTDALLERETLTLEEVDILAEAQPA